MILKNYKCDICGQRTESIEKQDDMILCKNCYREMVDYFNHFADQGDHHGK